VNISINTLMLAIKAVQRDIDWHERIASDDSTDDETAEYHGQYVLDLSQALSELGTLYQEARQRHPDCPSLDDLVRG
jgi:hypothetical protein